MSEETAEPVELCYCWFDLMVLKFRRLGYHQINFHGGGSETSDDGVVCVCHDDRTDSLSAIIIKNSDAWGMLRDCGIDLVPYDPKTHRFVSSAYEAMHGHACDSEYAIGRMQKIMNKRKARVIAGQAEFKERELLRRSREEKRVERAHEEAAAELEIRPGRCRLVMNAILGRKRSYD